MNGRYQESSNVVLDSSEVNDGPEHMMSYSEKRNKVNSQLPKSANSSFTGSGMKQSSQTLRSSANFIRQSLSNQRISDVPVEASRNVNRLKQRSSTEIERNQTNVNLGHLMNYGAPTSQSKNRTQMQDPYQSPQLDVSHKRNMSNFVTQQSQTRPHPS